MGIKGFQGTSLLDYPGKVASLVFFGGCNLTCPFCHNPSLVLDPESLSDVPTAALLEELERRRPFVDGVVVTGGEPTLDRDLLPFMRSLKTLGLAVKLDTNGLAPSVLEKALSENLADFVALDLKTSPARYGELHRGPVSLTDLTRSVRLLLEGPVPHEIRTTCVPGLVEEEDIRRMGDLIQGAQTWVLQQFHPSHALDEDLKQLEPHPPERLRAFVALAREYAREVSLRGL